MLPSLPIALLIFYVFPLFPPIVRRGIIKGLDLWIERMER